MNNMSLHFNVYGEKSEKYRTFFAKIFVGKKSLLMLVIGGNRQLPLLPPPMITVAKYHFIRNRLLVYNVFFFFLKMTSMNLVSYIVSFMYLA